MKRLVVLAFFALASVVCAQEGATAIRNVCDSLALGDQPSIELVPAYIEETNWYGNPHTWEKDSSTYKRHDSYETLSISVKSTEYGFPLSVKAACRETRGTEYLYVTWKDRAWSKKSADDYATYIFDIHSLTMEGHDSTNTYNLLAFVPGMIPENSAFSATQLLYSKTFEFAFEWWFVVASYTHSFRGTGVDSNKVYTTILNANSAGNDSLSVYEGAINRLEIPDTTKMVRVQVVKVVLSDSRKLPEPESSSSEPPVASSSSATPVSSSSAIPGTSSSGQNPGTSSSHSVDVSSSSVVGSSSSGTPASSSSQNGGSSSSANPGTSTSVAGSSSSAGNGSSSSAGGNGEGTETSSSGTDPQSSSSEDKTRLVAVQAESAPARVLQVRSLDGSVVKNSKNLAPGVYYVKNSNGKWQKMAVLPR